MEKLKDAHYFQLSSQGNIYTLVKLELANGTNKLLVASLKREVFCFEYQETPTGTLVPTTKDVSFTYIPSGAEIISMDAFNKSETNNDFVIGITIVKNSNESNALETYLNIYSEWEENVEFNIESISQNCLNIELNFIPYHLTHTNLISWEDGTPSKEVVFLLAGSDNKIHIYRENVNNHVYKEIDCKEFFPEFYKPPSVVIWIDVYYFDDYRRRLTAFGCECGYVRLCKINVKTNKIMFNFSVQLNDTISNVRIYLDQANIKVPAVLDQVDVECAEEVLNLVVTNTILPTVLFKDVLTYGLRKYGPLIRHEATYVTACMEIADIDFDGHFEILLGTSNQEIMLYKFDDKKGWWLKETKKFAAPVLGLKYLDVTGDGVKELIVLTMRGVHILQHDPAHVQKMAEKKLKMLPK